jgi:predicted Ser/Thr protein kinase
MNATITINLTKTIINVNNTDYMVRLIGAPSKTSEVFITECSTFVFKIVKKFIQYDIFEREILLLQRLNQDSDFAPTLLKYDENTRTLMMTYCGTPLNDSNKPADYNKQLLNIYESLQKSNIQHNDIKKQQELLVLREKIYLCDYGWASINRDHSCGIGLWSGVKPSGYIANEVLVQSNPMTLMDRALRQIVLKSGEIVWHQSPSKLTCVIVEPRNHPNLRGTLYNMANVYSNKNVGLTIYHSAENLELINEITKEWVGVTLHCLNQNNLTIKEYSFMLTTSKFYDSIKSSHLLIFQTDSCIFKSISEEYFKYDYVGAKWKKQIGNGCGNGGFSLRRKSTMLRACRDNQHKRHPEDVFFAHTQKMKLPSKSLQEAFSVERIKHLNPIGCHKFLTDELYIKLVPYCARNIRFGSSKKNTKRVPLNAPIAKHHNILLKPTKYPDTFDFQIKKGVLIIKRTDSDGGWGHKHTCHVLIL